MCRDLYETPPARMFLVILGAFFPDQPDRLLDQRAREILIDSRRKRRGGDLVYTVMAKVGRMREYLKIYAPKG